MTEQFAGLNNQLHKEMEAEIAQLEKVLLNGNISSMAVSYTHLTLPTIHVECRSRWSPYH